MHEQNVIHSDLKAVRVRPIDVEILLLMLLPQENVALSADKRALISDFSCARVMQWGEVSLVTRGTHSFWAPELVLSEEEKVDSCGKVLQSKATDIWALGMTIYVGPFGNPASS